jgi:hypothetical protein
MDDNLIFRTNGLKMSSGFDFAEERIIIGSSSPGELEPRLSVI